MKVVKSNAEARELISKGYSPFKKQFAPIKQFVNYIMNKFGSQAKVGIVLEAGETIVLTALIATVGALVAYAIFKGYKVLLKREKDSDGKDKWYLEFTNPTNKTIQNKNADNAYL